METNKTYGKDGFKTPKGYFENFETKLFEKIIQEDTEKHNDVLSKQISSGLNTPNDYFENLESSILEKTIHLNTKAKVIPLVSRNTILYFSGIAAMIAIIIAITIPKETDLLNTLDSIELSYIQQYLNEENIELDDSDISALFNEDQELIITLTDEELNDDALINYLSHEELENELIYTE